MCLDCGCNKPNDDHGDSRHITLDKLTAAAKASNISVPKAVENIQHGVSMAAASSARQSSATAHQQG